MERLSSLHGFYLQTHALVQTSPAPGLCRVKQAQPRRAGFSRQRIYPHACAARRSSVCPSCNTRRMAEAAVHLTDHVFPRLPVRQWVLSVPKRLRYYLQRDKGALNAALRIFLRVVQQSLQTHCPGAAKVDPAHLHLGAVAFIHRFNVPRGAVAGAAASGLRPDRATRCATCAPGLDQPGPGGLAPRATGGLAAIRGAVHRG